MNRQVELVRADALKHRAIAMEDKLRRLEYLEIAEALDAAADALEHIQRHGRRTTNGRVARK